MKYGPQTTEIETLIERLFRLTPDEIQGLTDVAWTTDADDARAAGDAAAAAWADANATWDAANAAWVAAVAAAAASAVAAAVAAAADGADDTAWADAWAAAGDAALGLATRHLIGTCGFTWRHYRTLTNPVATVLGPLHSDD